jgi:nicotinate-nucleotide pyrophosphorylase
MTPRRESELAAHGFYWEEGLHFPLTKKETATLVAAALEEDDAKHDITTAATVLSDRRARCRLVARKTGVLSGLELAREAFAQLDKAVTIRTEHEDGARIKPETPVMFLSGHARGLLSAERVALNFVQRLSGIASLTARYVEAIAGCSYPRHAKNDARLAATREVRRPLWWRAQPSLLPVVGRVDQGQSPRGRRW